MLVVHGDSTTMAAIAYQLVQAGWRVTTGQSRAVVLDLLDRHGLDAVLLHVTLMDSLADLLTGPRRAGATEKPPVIILLGEEGYDDLALDYLERGADDYVANPASVRELLLRLKRAVDHRQALARPEHPDDVRIDYAAHRAYAYGNGVDLTPIEFRLLSVLLSERGRLIERRRLVDTWHAPLDLSTRTVDMHIRRLRAKLSHASPGAGKLIETVHGEGYRFAPVAKTNSVASETQPNR